MRVIRTAEYEELQAVSDLMSHVFLGPMQDDYNIEARERFLYEISLSSLQKRFFDKSLFYLLFHDDKMEGVLELEQPSHIAFLFAVKEGEGIGKTLCRTLFDTLDESMVTVGAFPKATGFYERLGFKRIGKEKTFNDLPFLLMIREIRRVV